MKKSKICTRETKKKPMKSYICVFEKKMKIYKLLSATATSLQSCPTLCDPIDSSPPSSPVPGIFQARTPEWVAISFSNT